MARAYISFLGTNNYLFCHYQIDNKQITENAIQYIQEATISLNCHSWTTDDRILICNTQESKLKNWLDNGHDNNCDGLYTRIKNLNIKPQVIPIDIPSGKTEEEIWEIFRLLYEQINEGDELVFDITHAFRSIPLLALSVINYAKTLKKCHVSNISYGALEALGSIYQVKEMEPTDRMVPIFNLTSFDNLLNWTQAIENYELSGNTSAITTLSVALIKNQSVDRTEAILLQQFAKKLEALTDSLSTCRALDITRQAKDVTDAVNKVKGSKISTPLKPLFEKISKISNRLVKDNLRGGLEVTNWCIEHNLIPQAYSIFQEALKTWVLLEIEQNEDEAINNKEYREIVNSASQIVAEKKDKDKWYGNMKKHPLISQKLINFFMNNKELVKLLDKLAKARNDILHAGYNENSLSADKLKNRIKDIVNEFESHFKFNNGKS